MALNRILFVCLLVAFAHSAFGQKNRYMVFFKDKEGTPYSVSDPSKFLSVRAIERRVKHNAPILNEDLPVSPAYLTGVRDAGAEVYFPTRWMNGVLVQCTPDLLPTLTALPYVDRVELAAPNSVLTIGGRTRSPGRTKSSKSAVTDTQLSMLGLDKMHEDGFHGEGIVIAFLDAGFIGVNTTEPFADVVQEGRVNIEASKDFVYNSGDVFQYDDHGTMVFSVVSGFQEGTFTGGAYEAAYHLYVTEEVPTEYRIEEYNWLFAAEHADSAGVHIIHSSLGYNDFQGTEFDYEKSEMDGKTTVVSKAAQMAADRGIVVIVSAGNEGGTSWQMITSPADSKDVLAVGSVTPDGVRSGSSSIGPSADGRIKPDVAALGVGTSVIEGSGNTGRASGTSLAAPLVTSLAAGILQRYPSLTNVELLETIRMSASQASSPDKFLGYGIPDYERIVLMLEKEIRDDFFQVYPNPSFTDSIVIKPLFPEEVDVCTIELISMDGKSVFNYETGFSRANPTYTKSLVQFASGQYFVRIHWNSKTFVYRFVKG